MDRGRSIELLRDELLRLLTGETTYLESSRRVARLRFDLEAEHDEDFLSFVLIDSETDHLPIGQQRQHWSGDALARKDLEIRQAEAWARSFGEDSARRLLERFCAHGASAEGGPARLE